jgi:hypothetical protein
MAIDKRVPRKLNSTKDNRIRSKDEFNDALNISITDDYGNIGGDGATATADSGDAGVIRPALGNTAVNANDLFTATNETRRCVGSVSDTRTGIVFFFISSTDPEEIGVYAIDTQGYLGGNAQTQTPIFRSEELNFQSTSHVVGEVVHLYDEDSVDDQQQFRPYLYFTDNVNEPRKLDVVRAAAAEANYADQRHNIVDFITACPKTSIAPITFEWRTDLSRSVSEFRGINGLTFAYQCIYNSGEESALSTFSELAVPPSLLSQVSSSNQDLNVDNVLDLTINKVLYEDQGDNTATFNYTDEISRIRILVREGDVGTWFVVDEVDAPADNADLTYEFYNDRVLTGITVEQANKQFDNLPQMAEALSVVENRLFYGNYVEGYDNGEVNASLTVNYINRPQDFLDIDLAVSPVILPRENKDQSNATLSHDLNFTLGNNRGAGFMIDCSDSDVDIPEGSVVSFNLRVQPAKHWHYYDSTRSYHGHRNMGVDNSPSSLESTRDINYNISGVYPNLPVHGRNEGVRNPLFGDLPRWHTTETGDFGEVGSKECIYGTSASNPLVLQGKPIEFGFTAITTQDISAAQSSSVLREIITRLSTGLTSPYAEVVGNAQLNSGYNISIPLDFTNTANPNLQGADELQPKYARLKPTASGDLTHINCITGVFDSEFSTSYGSTTVNPCPMGYFMIRNANVEFTLNQESTLQEVHGNDARGFLSLSLNYLNIQGAWDSEEPGIVTCIPHSNDFEGNSLAPDSLFVKEWRVYKYLDLVQKQTLYYDDLISWQTDQPIDDVGATNELINFFAIEYLDGLSGSNVTGFNDLSRDQRQLWIGGLQYEQGDASTEGAPFQNNLLLTGNEPSDQPLPIFSMLDGEGGPRNIRRTGLVENPNNFSIISLSGIPIIDIVADLQNDEAYTLRFDAATNVEEGLYSYNQIFLGHASSSAGGIGIDVNQSDASLLYPFGGYTNLPTSSGGGNRYIYWALLNSPVFTRFENMDISMSTGEQFVFDNDPAPPAVAVNILNSNIYFTEGEDGDIVRSFKSSANHQLGIVYYDERGRSGPVAPLPSRDNPSVYVEGYNVNLRNGLLGRAEITVDMDTTPPDWAWAYQFVYAGNSTYDDFYQFTTGGAFVPNSDSSEAKVIYVSLNYLQSNSDVSYAEAFGAVDYTGDKTFYQFVPGDYLRILSYYVNDENRVYPINYSFEIAGVVNLPDNPDENPIAGGVFVDQGAGVHPARQGSFIVLKDNPSAGGFTAGEVASGTSLIDTNAHYWNNRCLVEVVRPKKLSDADQRAYYEIGRSFRISRVDGQLQHEFEQHLIRQGDVWWRRVPNNVVNWDAEQALFPNLIQEENEEELILNAPRFRDIYLESMTFSDSYAGNNVLGKGKPKFIGPDRQRVRRFSSIIFSDLNDYSTNVNRFTSFNAYNMPFKDLPNEHGPINYLINFNDSLFIVQKDKASTIPVSRDIITTATGQDSIVVSNKILGSQIHYAGAYGSDNNPESVLKVGNNVYFAHKNRGEVYKFNPSNGIQIISDKGMSSHIRDDFQDLLASGDVPKVVSGYDPLNDEYLISIVGLNPFAVDATLFDRPAFETVGGFDINPTTPTGDTSVDVFDGAFDDPVSDFTGVDDGVEVIDNNWDEILEDFTDYNDYNDEVFGGDGGSGIVNVNEDTVIPWTVNGNNQIVVDVKPYISVKLAAELGNTPIAQQGQGGVSGVGLAIGNFNATTREITLLPAYTDLGAPVINSLVRSAVQINGVNLPIVAGYAELLGNFFPASLGEKMLANTYEKYRLTAVKVQTTKTSGDQSLNTAIETIQDDVAKLPALLSEFDSGNNALQQYALDITQALDSFNTAVGLVSYSDTVISNTLPASPNGTTTSVEYPAGYGIEYTATNRGGAFDAYLTAIQASSNSLNLTIGSLNPNELLDTSGVYSNLSSRISDLQSTLDVVTDQLEEASSVRTALDPNQTPFIQNVASGGNNTFTLAALAQSQGIVDRDLGQTDIVLASQLADTLDFLSGNGVEVTAELVEELSNQVAGEVLDQYRGTSYESLFPNAFRTDGKFQTEGQSNVEALNRAIDIADYNGTGVYGQGALLEALTDGYYDSEIFGVPVVSAGFFNGIISFAFDDLPSTTPFAEVATYFRNKLLSRYSEEYLNSLTGFDTTLQNIGFLWGLSAIPSFIGAVLNAWGAIVNKLAPFGGVQTAAAPFSEDIYNNPNKRPSITPIYQEIADQYNNA